MIQHQYIHLQILAKNNFLANAKKSQTSCKCESRNANLGKVATANSRDREKITFTFRVVLKGCLKCQNHILWSLYFKTTYRTMVIWSYIEGDLKIKVQ